MKIGEKFTFLSNGVKRKALFQEQLDDKITCVIYGDQRTEGTTVIIHESQVIPENQISMFDQNQEA